MSRNLYGRALTVNTQRHCRSRDNAPMYKNHPGDVLRELMRREPDVTPSELARRTGVRQPTIHRLLEKESANPKVSTLRPLAEYYSVTLSQMYGDEPLDGSAAEQPSMPHGLKKRVRVVGQVPLITHGRAQEICSAPEPLTPRDGLRMIDVYSAADLSDRAFALEVLDDSMVSRSDPSFPKGTVIIVDPDRTPSPRNFVIAYVDGDAEVTFAQLVRTAGRLLLKPLNDAYPATVVDATVTLCGVVVTIAERNLLGN